MSHRLPGIHDKLTANYRQVSLAHQKFLPSIAVIDGSLSRDPGNGVDEDELRAGMPMGLVTASGKWAPSIIGVLAVLHDTSATPTALTVPAAAATEIVRRFGASGTFNLIGPPTAAGTVVTEQVTYSAVNTSTGVITVTATSADFAAGSIIAPEDGSEIPRVLLGDGHATEVTDENDENVDVFPVGGMLVGGHIDTDKIVDYSSDSSVQDWLKTSLNDYSQFTFKDDLS